MVDKNKTTKVFVLAGSSALRRNPRGMSSGDPAIDIVGEPGNTAGRLCDDGLAPAGRRPSSSPAMMGGLVDRRHQRFGRRQSEIALMESANRLVAERMQAQAELERSHAELRELVAALDSMRVEEQQRLAHEMHDDFGQSLAAMKMDISSLRKQLPRDDPRLARHLESIDELVDTMVGSVRRIVAGLPPEAIEEAGLFSALASLTAAFEKRHGIVCRLHLSKPEPALDAKVAAAIYRMIQESLNNVARHAAARHVEARVECAGGDIRLCVRDDGCGIMPDKMRKPGAFGLIGMRQRANALCGEMHVESNGAGTAISITIPLRPTDPRP
jgi:two-component system sensor kinase